MAGYVPVGRTWILCKLGKWAPPETELSCTEARLEPEQLKVGGYSMLLVIYYTMCCREWHLSQAATGNSHSWKSMDQTSFMSSPTSCQVRCGGIVLAMLVDT